MEPDVTIGLPVYNGEDYLRPALDSLLGQSYRAIRLVVSDNASTDATEAICREYAARDPRLVYQRQEENRGENENFNIVFRAADTPYFMWACHDDVWSQHYIALLRDALETNSDAVLAYGDTQEIDEHGAPMIRRSLPDLARTASRFERLATLILSHEGSGKANAFFGLYRTDAIRRLPEFDDDSRHGFGGDVLYLYRVALLGKFVHVPQAIFFKRNPRAKIRGKKDETPEAVQKVRELTQFQAEALFQSRTLERQFRLGRIDREDALQRTKAIQARMNALLADVRAAFDFFFEHWPPILEYFAQIERIIDESDFDESEKCLLKLVVQIRCSHWMLPLLDKDGDVSGAHFKQLSDVLAAYVTLFELGASTGNTNGASQET